MGAYRPPKVPFKVWDHLDNDAHVKIEKFKIWIFFKMMDVKFEHIFLCLVGGECFADFTAYCGGSQKLTESCSDFEQCDLCVVRITRHQF